VSEPQGTDDSAYAARLERLEGIWWKRVLDVQRPYRWNLRRLDPGFTLDVGCGLGRNLTHLDGNGVGIDHNSDSVAVARRRGLKAFTPDEFERSEYAQPGTFDSLLCAHVVEHMPADVAVELLRPFVAYVRPGGKVILITPQERGFRSDPTHVEYFDFAALDRLVGALGLVRQSARSFPLPRAAGHVFTHNEFVVVARVPTSA
jgi:2-polyprenyl-3-methyl-5-hydroxy-6-metoxy-1,4-benzoquinol methylase